MMGWGSGWNGTYIGTWDAYGVRGFFILRNGLWIPAVCFQHARVCIQRQKKGKPSAYMLFSWHSGYAMCPIFLLYNTETSIQARHNTLSVHPPSSNPLLSRCPLLWGKL